MGEIREQPRFLRAWPRPLAGPAGLSLAIALAAAVFMALAGPFGTWREPLAERLGFWIIGMAGCTVVGLGLDRGLAKFALLGTSRAWRAPMVIGLIVGPATVAAAFAASLVEHRPIDWEVTWRTAPQIALVGAALAALLLMARRPPAPVVAPTLPDDRRIGGLLPLRLAGARLLALEAQDHYVRVHTDRGSDLVLVSLEAALAKVAHLEGRRVHRSWWVARQAMAGVKRGDGRAVLSLPGGLQAPVSRRYARQLRAAGWY